jgi:preprotein translocase subunit SecG
MRPLLSDLTAITIWTAVPFIALTMIIRLVWRHGKHVEEP